MVRYVALPGRAPVHLVPAGRVVEELEGLDGLSLKKIGKGLKKVGKFVDKNKWLIAGAAAGGWALAGKAAGKSSALSAVMKGGKKVVAAATPLAEAVGTQMLQNAIAPQGNGMEAGDPYGAGAMPADAAGSGSTPWVLPAAVGAGLLLVLMMKK